MLASSSSLLTVSSCPRLLILPLNLSSHAGLLICPVCCPPLHWTPCPPARYHFHTGLLIFPPPCPLLHWLSFPPCSLATPSLTFQIIPHSCLVFLAYPSLWIPAPCPPCPTFTLALFSLPLLLTLHPCADFLFLSTHHPPCLCCSFLQGLVLCPASSMPALGTSSPLPASTCQSRMLGVEASGRGLGSCLKPPP